jgi:G3E family GTPase
MKPIPLYFIAGFLGAGKTTVLNSLLGSLNGRRAGLIINEFGAVGIDASRVENSSRDIFELNNGQIFCACLAAPLASSLIQLAEKGPDLILAECSGLSKPSTLQDMVAGIAKTSEGKIELAGLITVVDGPRYPVLSQTVQAVREQVAYAGAVVLNKTDLISSAEVAAAETLLREVNPRVSVLPAIHGRISISEIERVLPLSSTVPGPEKEYMGWGDSGRPKSYYLHSLNPVSKDSRYGLDRFLQKAAEKAFRIKGALPAKEGGYFFVDCVEENLVCELKAEEAPVQGLVIIVPGDGVGAEYFSLLWNDQMKTEAQLR